MAAKTSTSSSTPLKMQDHDSKKKRVLIIGAGCSGMSAAYAFSLSPDKFDVCVYDKAPSVGGSATSYQLPDTVDFGAQYINDGVQGASPVFFNTFKMFEEVLGFKASDVGLQISFGKGKDTFWSNVFPSQLVDQFQDDIKKVNTR
jgi:predicted NAD/FAD-binding protein